MTDAREGRQKRLRSPKAKPGQLVARWGKVAHCKPAHYRNFASTFGALMRRLVARAKKEKRPFRRFRAHDLRHGFAIRWLHQGGDLYELSKHLGHSSIKTTEIYLDFATDKHTAQMGAQWEPNGLHEKDKKAI